MRLLLEPEAQVDLATAFEWYEQQQAGLGSVFLAEIARVLIAIEKAPSRHRIVSGQTRRARVGRFPYAAYYVIEGEMVSVTAILHEHRNPRAWQNRGSDLD